MVAACATGSGMRGASGTGMEAMAARRERKTWQRGSKTEVDA
jgi:hypothetical protein